MFRPTHLLRVCDICIEPPILLVNSPVIIGNEQDDGMWPGSVQQLKIRAAPQDFFAMRPTRWEHLLLWALKQAVRGRELTKVRSEKALAQYLVDNPTSAEIFVITLSAVAVETLKVFTERIAQGVDYSNTHYVMMQGQACATLSSEMPQLVRCGRVVSRRSAARNR